MSSDSKKPSKPVDTYTCIARYKLAGWDNKRIAEKMGMSEEQVMLCVQDLQQQADKPEKGTHFALIMQYTTLTHQFQLLGESLKIVARAIGDEMPSSELRALIVADPEQTLRNLQERAIVLRPFIPQDVDKSLEDYLARMRAGN